LSKESTSFPVDYSSSAVHHPRIVRVRCRHFNPARRWSRHPDRRRPCSQSRRRQIVCPQRVRARTPLVKTSDCQHLPIFHVKPTLTPLPTQHQTSKVKAETHRLLTQLALPYTLFFTGVWPENDVRRRRRSLYGHPSDTGKFELFGEGNVYSRLVFHIWPPPGLMHTNPGQYHGRPPDRSRPFSHHLSHVPCLPARDRAFRSKATGRLSERFCRSCGTACLWCRPPNKPDDLSESLSCRPSILNARFSSREAGERVIT